MYGGFIYRGAPINVGSLSMQKLLFECKCGKIKKLYIATITKKKQVTCGECKKILIKPGQKLGEFIYAGYSEELIGPNSSRQLPFRCRCGKEKCIRIDSVFTRKTIRCRSCNEIELVPNRKYGTFVYIGKSIITTPKSGMKKFLFLCSCGKEKLIRIQSVFSGHETTCGMCNSFILNQGTKHNNLTYSGSCILASPGSHKKLLFLCHCGKEKHIKLHAVLDESIKSCGECSIITLVNNEKFGSFTYMGNNVTLSKWSKQKMSFMCRCGQMKFMSVRNIVSGRSKSCGGCRGGIHNWYIRNASLLGAMRTPIHPSDIPIGGIVFLKMITNVGKPTPSICHVCGSIYNPRFSDVKRGRSLTCGCVSNRISSPAREISSFIESLGHDTCFEYQINNKHYDICILNKKILIEYHGKFWHSSAYSKELDANKLELAKKSGFQLITITEEEWKNSKQVKSVLSKVCEV